MKQVLGPVLDDKISYGTIEDETNLEKLMNQDT